MAKGDAHRAFVSTFGRLPKRGEILRAEQSLRKRTGSSKGLVAMIKSGRMPNAKGIGRKAAAKGKSAGGGGGG